MNVINSLNDNVAPLLLPGRIAICYNIAEHHIVNIRSIGRDNYEFAITATSRSPAARAVTNVVGTWFFNRTSADQLQGRGNLYQIERILPMNPNPFK